MSSNLSAYLDVMGIEQWVLRTVETEVVEVPLPPSAVVDPASEPVPVLATASLASFPTNDRGQFLIVCGSASAAEGQGSAFEGAPADLLNAMLGATQWPAGECVLLADVSQLSLAMEQVKPSILVALGEVASQAVLQGAVQAKRQQIHSLASVQAIASYHPVQAQNDPVQFKRPIWEDLKLAMAAVAK